MRALCALVWFAACSVPELSLDGKLCPCVEPGYECDMDTNRCLRTNDAGMIIDSPAATQCLPVGPEMELYRYAGGVLDGWTEAGGTWTGGSEITQTSINTQDAYLFKHQADLRQDYRVISAMRPVDGGTGEPALGIVRRAQLDTQNKSRYSCNWVGKTRVLKMDVWDGNNVSTVQTKTIPTGVMIPATFTMEAAVTGSTVACCIREITGASVTGTNTLVPMGYPGLTTSRMHGAFGSFVVLSPI